MTTVYRTKFFRVCVLVAAGCLLTAGGALASEKAAGWQAAGQEVKEAAGAVGEATKESAVKAWEVTKDKAAKAVEATREAAADAKGKIADKTGAGGYGSRSIVAVIWPPSKQPLVVGIYITQTKASMQASNQAIARIGVVLKDTVAP